MQHHRTDLEGSQFSCFAGGFDLLLKFGQFAPLLLNALLLSFDLLLQ